MSRYIFAKTFQRGIFGLATKTQASSVYKLNSSFVRSSKLAPLPPLTPKTFYRNYFSNQADKSLKDDLAGYKLNKDSLELIIPSVSNDMVYPYLWLRDNCRCPKCIHATNRQKLHSTGEISLDVSPQRISVEKDPVTQKAKLVIQWNGSGLRREVIGDNGGDHVSEYEIDWLQKNLAIRESSELVMPYTLPQNQLWTGSEYEKSFEFVDYDALMNTTEGFKHLLRNLSLYGLAFIKNAPTNDQEVALIAERFGPIMETFYGRTWDVKSVQNSTNIAYTDLYLGQHMDLCYYESPPGIQFLHCLVNEVTGGESMFVDSYKAASVFCEKYPEEAKILESTKVNFHYDHESTYMHNQHYTLSRDRFGQINSVFYAPPFQGPIEFGNPEEVPKFYDAFTKFEKIIEDPSFTFTYKLKEGEVAAFANRRVLHSRKGFDSTSGNRHYKGTYLRLDEFNDRLRILKP
ncbi:hypothetical protein BB558_006416 [Smittium angustum]|uniref:TauD/TfdA-like domain-containing protein n=1 Tax=Smittium angustum TaxID=133377 RepID=A0A2U1IXV7_SMIAN|nr:hypothetical protein BB558_006416 [Smittium angustum]